MRLAIPLVLAAAVATPVAADTPEKAAAFMGAMRDAGCEMSLEAADDAAEALGIEITELDEIIDLLFFGGQLFIDAEEHMTMLSTLCAAPPQDDAGLFARLQEEIDLEGLDAATGSGGWMVSGHPPPERAALVISALRGNDCGLAHDEAEEILSVVGITPTEVHAVTAVLLDAGMVEPGAVPGHTRLADEVCLADPAGDVALYEMALARLIAEPELGDPDAVLADRFGEDGIRAVLEFMAGASDCVLDTDDRARTVDEVVDFLAFNVAGIHNLPAEFSPEAEAELRDLVARVLDDPGPAYEVEPGRLVLIDCTP